MSRGSKLFEYDFDDFSVGTAEHKLAATGCTAFRFKESFLGAVDARGGAVAVGDVLSLSLENTWGSADGLMFAGGSSYGLAAAEGAKAALMAERKSTDFLQIPAVPAAIVYDFRDRQDTFYPDATLGREAWESAIPNQVWTGARGAGRNVSVGKILNRDGADPSGQGAAFARLGDIKIFALSVVNAAGCIINRSGEVIAGNLDRASGRRMTTREGLAEGSLDTRGNTTISVVITNVKLDRVQLHRLCSSVHMGLGRVIEPYATASDGDVMFAFTSGRVELPANVSQAGLASLGAWTAQDAVLSAIEAVKS
jgi:L-aminopeptidase/D-esterase-like protein